MVATKIICEVTGPPVLAFNQLGHALQDHIGPAVANIVQRYHQSSLRLLRRMLAGTIRRVSGTGRR
jgi:hypothetical protein